MFCGFVTVCVVVVVMCGLFMCVQWCLGGCVNVCLFVCLRFPMHAACVHVACVCCLIVLCIVLDCWFVLFVFGSPMAYVLLWAVAVCGGCRCDVCFVRVGCRLCVCVCGCLFVLNVVFACLLFVCLEVCCFCLCVFWFVCVV